MSAHTLTLLMKKLLGGILFLGLTTGWLAAEVKPALSARELEVLIVVGAEGSEEYGRRFAQSEADWKTACQSAAVMCSVIGHEKGSDADAKVLEDKLRAHAEKTSGSLWLILIGHGTFDGRDAKFNLRGPDLSAVQLAGWLKPLKQELVFVHTGSASAPFAKAIAGPGRICVSATKSADEVFYTRFGEFFSKAIAGLPEADLDQDKQVSVLESFLHASKEVAEFYETEERLATEHSLLDDNGDGVGTRSEVFVGTRAANAAASTTPDGERARQLCLVLNDQEKLLSDETRRTRDNLEREIQNLHGKKSTLPEAEYYTQMEALLLKLGRLYPPAPAESAPVQSN